MPVYKLNRPEYADDVNKAYECGYNTALREFINEVEELLKTGESKEVACGEALRTLYAKAK